MDLQSNLEHNAVYNAFKIRDMSNALKLILCSFAGGPYEVFAGRDATIGLATFNMAKMKKETNGELNLSEKHQRNVAHWEKLFKGW